VYPQQGGENVGKCWNWFDERHQSRVSGEPAIIAGITNEIIRTHRVDAARVFLAGMSAGAAMANVVAINHPEVYAALALHSGMEFKASTSLATARQAMTGGGPDPVAQGRLAHAAMGKHARVVPVFIIHGLQDKVVPPLHAQQLTQQWLTIAELLGADSAESQSNLTVENDYAVTRTITLDKDGRLLVLNMEVHELGHAWSGGSPEGTYTDAKGPDATLEMLQFFLGVIPPPSPSPEIS
ncbi:MAG: extracellular catalytic domain type 1 short-chain-length polyhydroxyalkanoate depolymerase, partial [Gemmatimonadota bacterium]